MSPLLFVNGEFEVELDAKGVELANFEVIILLSISALDTDGQSITFRKVINVDDEQSERDEFFGDFLVGCFCHLLSDTKLTENIIQLVFICYFSRNFSKVK